MARVSVLVGLALRQKTNGKAREKIREINNNNVKGQSAMKQPHVNNSTNKRFAIPSARLIDQITLLL
jgi:hypothetical protein